MLRILFTSGNNSMFVQLELVFSCSISPVETAELNSTLPHPLGFLAAQKDCSTAGQSCCAVCAVWSTPTVVAFQGCACWIHWITGEKPLPYFCVSRKLPPLLRSWHSLYPSHEASTSVPSSSSWSFCSWWCGDAADCSSGEGKPGQEQLVLSRRATATSRYSKQSGQCLRTGVVCAWKQCFGFLKCL